MALPTEAANWIIWFTLVLSSPIASKEKAKSNQIKTKQKQRIKTPYLSFVFLISGSGKPQPHQVKCKYNAYNTKDKTVLWWKWHYLIEYVQKVDLVWSDKELCSK